MIKGIEVEILIFSPNILMDHPTYVMSLWGQSSNDMYCVPGSNLSESHSYHYISQIFLQSDVLS